ncbi:MAG: hypothetical protein GC162_13700 [Planctomycetes bacterium]|nr:hypothetical protein [Planctomycetota bacterium]
MPEQPEPSPWRFMGAGLELAGVIGLMAAIGYGIDRYFGSDPWGVMIGACLGLVGGLYNLIKMVKQLNDR